MSAGVGQARPAPETSVETPPLQTHLWEGGKSEITHAPSLDPPVLQTQTVAFLHQRPGKGMGWGRESSWAQRWAGPRPGYLAHLGRSVDGENWASTSAPPAGWRRFLYHPIPGRPEKWAVGQNCHLAGLGQRSLPRETPFAPTCPLWNMAGGLGGSHLASPSPHLQTLCSLEAVQDWARQSGIPTATMKSPGALLGPERAWFPTVE